MTLLLYLIVIVANVITGILYRNNIKNRSNAVILFFTYIIVFLLMSGYRNTSGLSNDLFYTELEYNNIVNGLVSNYEFGYVFLMKLGGVLHQEFYTYRSIIIGVFLLFLFVAIRKWAPSPHYVIALFSSYLIILSAEQLRYFIAFSIFAIGLLILLYSNFKCKKMSFLCFTLFASTIHFSFLIYLIFIFGDFSHKTKREKIIVSVTLLFCLVIFINNNQIPGVSELLESVDNYKVSVYMGQSTNLGFMYPFVLHMSSILLSFWAIKLISKSEDDELIMRVRNVYKINLLAVIFFPLFMLQLTFYRLARNLLLLNYFAYSQIRVSKKIDLGKKKIFAFAVWNSVVLWILVDLFIKTSADALIIPFFTENIFFNFF
ncbi:EpsG family protein [Rossellomorea marisflavi]|uniref:EpsG family protein n=1 Tax=Rossellomorea marisflavi TaxID=189381 RepID=UPI003D2EA817